LEFVIAYGSRTRTKALTVTERDWNTNWKTQMNFTFF